MSEQEAKARGMARTAFEQAQKSGTFVLETFEYAVQVGDRVFLFTPNTSGRPSLMGSRAATYPMLDGNQVGAGD